MKNLSEFQRLNNTGRMSPADVQELIDYARSLEAAMVDRLNYDFDQAQQPAADQAQPCKE